MYKVNGTNHDDGARDIELSKNSKEDAEWSADLMRQCGYKVTITVTQKAN